MIIKIRQTSNIPWSIYRVKCLGNVKKGTYKKFVIIDFFQWRYHPVYSEVPLEEWPEWKLGCDWLTMFILVTAIVNEFFNIFPLYRHWCLLGFGHLKPPLAPKRIKLLPFHQNKEQQNQGRRPRGGLGGRSPPQNLRWGTAHALVPPQYFEK